MLNRLFPASFDNVYRGRRLGLWLLYPITLFNLLIALGTIFSADSAAGPDGIPLAAYPPDAARAVVGVAGFLGLSDLLLAFFSVLALVRYRSMVPLIYLVLVVQWLAHKGVGLMKPIARDGAHMGGYITLAIFALSLAGLVLSLREKAVRKG
jgi:hypothetical protein